MAVSSRACPDWQPAGDGLAAAASERHDAGTSGAINQDLSGAVMGLYLREIAHHRLLSAEEEVLLAQQLGAGKLAARVLSAGGVGLPDPRRSELERLTQVGEAARRQLIECNLRLVVTIASRYRHRGIAVTDLVQEGNIGLHTGVDKYDWRLGYRFTTYVYWWIRQAILRAITRQGRTIRLPAHIYDQLSMLARAESDLTGRLHRVPTIDEVAQYLDVDPARIRELRRADISLLSLETRLGEPDDVVRADVIADPTAPTVADLAEARDMAERLESVLDELPPRERQVLRLRYALGARNGPEYSLDEIGERLGLSSERIRQIEQQALAKLRRMPRLRLELSDYRSG
ncbi:MAG: sigma-70 family RNA polymerase sigma factor [Chloroflexi bacterium]|nr:sigma-70 family RNA polymerase sigma factor [Chloroflexota bacterium]